VSLHFIPKTSVERHEFLQHGEAQKAEADREEQRLLREWLPTLTYPFQEPFSHPEIVLERAMVPMRDGVALRSHMYRTCCMQPPALRTLISSST
jgi:predicted acyl esterase